MRLGTGGIFAVAVSGAIVTGLIFTFSVSSFMRETSGDTTRWQAQTAQGRSDLTTKANETNLSGNTNRSIGLPPAGDEDNDGVPNGVDPDPTNPDNPKPNSKEFHIDGVDKFVVDSKKNELTKNIKVPQYGGGLFPIHIEFTNDAKTRTVRVNDYPDHGAAMNVAIPASPEPVVCLSGKEMADFNDDFCIGDPALQPDSIKIISKKPPIWDIEVSKPGKYKIILYATGEVLDAGKQLNTVEALDRSDLSKKNRREKDSASITGINQLDIKLAKYVRLSDGSWGDTAKSYLGEDKEFRVVLDLNNQGGDHSVALKDQLSGLIFKEGTVQINDQDPVPLTVEDISRWYYNVPRNALGKQTIVFSFKASVITYGIGTNTATVYEVGKVSNHATERVFVVTVFEFGPQTAPCSFCKVGRIKDSGDGFTNLLFAKARDKVEFEIFINVAKNSPINLKDLLPSGNQLSYLADTLTIQENGKKKDIKLDDSFFNQGFLLEPTTGQSSWFTIDFVGQINAADPFNFKNIAVAHKPDTDPNTDKTAEMTIVSQ